VLLGGTGHAAAGDVADDVLDPHPGRAAGPGCAPGHQAAGDLAQFLGVGGGADLHRLDRPLEGGDEARTLAFGEELADQRGVSADDLADLALAVPGVQQLLGELGGLVRGRRHYGSPSSWSGWDALARAMHSTSTWSARSRSRSASTSTVFRSR